MKMTRSKSKKSMIEEDCLFTRLYLFDNFNYENKIFRELVCNEHPNCPAVELCPVHSNLSEGDILSKQKKLILAYKENPFVDSSLQGKKKIEQHLAEVSQINKGIKRYIPRRKNKEHNRKVDYLGQIIGKTNVFPFYTRGIFTPDNLVTGAVGPVLVGLTGIVIGSFTYGFNLSAAAKLLIPTTFLSGIFGNFGYSSRKEPYSELEICTDAEARARYVDRKIEDLFS